MPHIMVEVDSKAWLSYQLLLDRLHERGDTYKAWVIRKIEQEERRLAKLEQGKEG